jgi:riboflavin synthase
LHALKAGQPVNIEADVMIKFMEQRSSKEEFDLTVEYLIANGY